MEYWAFFLLLSFILACIYFYSGRRSSAVGTRLPPGPYPLPVIGNILQLGNKPHLSLAALSKTYGPLMSLKLGAATTVVVSSPETAGDLFSNHDLAFSTRSVPFAGDVIRHPDFSMVWLPVGDQWRSLRRISKEHLFSVQQLDASRRLRAEKVRELLDHVRRCRADGRALNVGRAASTTTLNVLSNFIFSVDLASYDSASSQDFKHIVGVLMEIAGKPNVADFFPVLRPLDPLGLRRKATLYCHKLMAFFDGIIDERLQGKCSGSGSGSGDVTDLLLDLSLKDKPPVSLDDIRHLFFDIFLAGTDTTSSTLEWAMTELIRHPEKLSKAQSELKEMIGNEEEAFKEQDISELPYLQAVVKETFRLHPPVPFLIPRRAVHDVEFRGFVVPKDAQILCNLWAMGRDPSVWSDAETFMPERFLNVETNYKGQDFELIPFGAGRRMCPGLPLAHRMLHLMLGSLIYHFDWKVEGVAKPQDIDMEEKFGITLQKNVPLVATPVEL